MNVPPKCGLVFNRHNWNYLHRGRYRVCEKCGECNYQFSSEWADYWFETTFDEMNRMIMLEKLDRINQQKTDVESRSKALESLKP